MRTREVYILRFVAFVVAIVSISMAYLEHQKMDYIAFWFFTLIFGVNALIWSLGEFFILCSKKRLDDPAPKKKDW